MSSIDGMRPMLSCSARSRSISPANWSISDCPRRASAASSSSMVSPGTSSSTAIGAEPGGSSGSKSSSYTGSLMSLTVATSSNSLSSLFSPPSGPTTSLTEDAAWPESEAVLASSDSPATCTCLCCAPADAPDSAFACMPESTIDRPGREASIVELRRIVSVSFCRRRAWTGQRNWKTLPSPRLTMLPCTSSRGALISAPLIITTPCRGVRMTRSVPSVSIVHRTPSGTPSPQIGISGGGSRVAGPTRICPAGRGIWRTPVRSSSAASMTRRKGRSSAAARANSFSRSSCHLLSHLPVSCLAKASLARMRSSRACTSRSLASPSGRGPLCRWVWSAMARSPPASERSLPSHATHMLDVDRMIISTSWESPPPNPGLPPAIRGRHTSQSLRAARG
eukprot:m.119047 g.119047  ORF g.119047 m.119047 type:complete len:394 (-) comp9248_c1_seq2:753-1934(-)